MMMAPKEWTQQLRIQNISGNSMVKFSMSFCQHKQRVYLGWRTLRGSNGRVIILWTKNGRLNVMVTHVYLELNDSNQPTYVSTKSTNYI